jgi:hypothetical protein
MGIDLWYTNVEWLRILKEVVVIHFMVLFQSVRISDLLNDAVRDCLASDGKCKVKVEISLLQAVETLRVGSRLPHFLDKRLTGRVVKVKGKES